MKDCMYKVHVTKTCLIAVFVRISVFYADHLYHLFANPNFTSFLKIIKFLKYKITFEIRKKVLIFYKNEFKI